MDGNAPGDLLCEPNGAIQRHEVVFAGGRVVWRCAGKGPPVLLLHGGHGSWRHWVRNVQALSEHYTVWMPDLPGYGDSDPPLKPTLDSLVEATSSTLNTLVGDATPIAVLGFSFGGLVAANLCARRGAVTQLALLGPAGHGGARRPRGELRSWRPFAPLIGSPDAAALAEVMRHNLALHMLHDPKAADAQAVRIHTDACLRTRFRSKPISRAAGLSAALSQYRGDLLLVWGEHDVTAIPALASEAIAAGRQGLRVHIIPDAGHWVQYERPAEVNGLLLTWLGGSQGPSRDVQHPFLEGT